MSDSKTKKRQVSKPRTARKDQPGKTRTGKSASSGKVSVEQYIEALKKGLMLSQ